MKKEITLQDIASSVEQTNSKVDKLADLLEQTNNNVAKLADAISATNKTVEVLAATMHQGFGKVFHEIEKLDNKIDGVKTELTDKIETVKTELENKIETEVGNLAGMAKREFDAITLRFNNMDNEFKEVHEEIGQVNNNVIGLERRVSKLEKAAVK